jgi:hypothetical protein
MMISKKKKLPGMCHVQFHFIKIFLTSSLETGGMFGSLSESVRAYCFKVDWGLLFTRSQSVETRADLSMEVYFCILIYSIKPY